MPRINIPKTANLRGLGPGYPNHDTKDAKKAEKPYKHNPKAKPVIDNKQLPSNNPY